MQEVAKSSVEKEKIRLWNKIWSSGKYRAFYVLLLFRVKALVESFSVFLETLGNGGGN